MSRGSLLRNLAAVSAAAVLAGFASPPVSAAGNAGLHLHKTVDPNQLTINPSIGVTLAVDKTSAIPADTLTYTAAVTNPTATFAMGGVINAEAVADADATVAYYWDELEVCAVDCGNGMGNPNWKPVATFEATQPGYQPVAPPQIHTGMSFAAKSIVRGGVVYPTSGDPILGTVISPSATAAWTYMARITLNPAEVAVLSDPTQVIAMRNVLHMEVTVRNSSAAQPYTDPELFTNPFTSAPNPGAITNVTVAFTLPDGSTVNVAATASLAPGASASASTTYKIPVPAARGQSESEDAYVARLHGVDGTALTASAVASGGGFSGTVYATSAPVTTNEFVPIVTIAKSGPASVDAGATETNPLSLQNVGGATASSPAITDTVPSGGVGAVSGTPASIAAGASASATAAFPVPVSQASGDLTDTASVTWRDGNGNTYGPLSSSFTTQVHNILFGATLSLAPLNAGPNVPGTQQTLTATLKDAHSNAIAGQVVHFVVTGANTASGDATTDASGLASFTYTGSSSGNDSAQATVTTPGMTITSNTSAISWLKLLQTVALSAVQGNFFVNAHNSCTFDISPPATPAFGQTFPNIMFNSDPSVIPHDISRIGNFTRPMFDKTTDVNGNYNGQIMAAGNGFQAGVAPLENFYAVFTGSFVVNQAGDLTFRILHDDGYIIGVGGGATRVNGDLEGNPPATTPFNNYTVVGAWNTGSTGSSSSGPVTVHFPAPGTYPFELDYTECASGPLFLDLLTESFVPQTSGLGVYVGYADALRAGGSAFPFPWNGSPNTTFVGCTDCRYDAGALRFDNNTSSPMTFDSITVDLAGGQHFDLWPHGITLPPGQLLVLTQTTGDNAGNFDNFDTSDFSNTPCNVNNGVIPTVHVTIAGVTTDYRDVNQILNTGGFDLVCLRNEDLPWRSINGVVSTINVPVAPAAQLNLMPFNIPNAVQGQSVSLTVSALDGGGNPLVNQPVTLEVIGANTQTASKNTDSAGQATFAYAGNFEGTDTVQAAMFNGGLRSISNQGTVIWTPPGGNTNNPLGATITNTTPAEGAVVTKPTAVDATIAPPLGQTIASWRVFYQSAAGGPQVVIGSGTGSPPSPLGVTFDPTLIADGGYTITVEATTNTGAVQDATSSVTVYGLLKLGRYTTTVQDMTASVSGYQMEVRRTYDSSDTSDGDFGTGWRVEVSNFRVSSNRILGAGGWLQYNKSCVLGLCFTAFKNGGPRYVTVVFPDQHTEIFDLTPDGGTNVFWSCAPKFTARAAVGTTSTLVPLDDTSCSYQGDGNLYGSNGLYNPQRFQLTTKAGQVIVLDRKFGLISTTDPDGNRLTVDAGGVHASSGQSIAFTRDASGRITDVNGPVANQHLHYDYFASPGPNELQKVTDPNGHAFTYAYTSGLLNSEVGPDGKPIVTVRYDASGRATSLAYGNNPAMTVNNDVAGQQQTIVDPNGGLTTIDTFDDLGQVVQRDEVFGGTTRTTKYAFDAVGHRTLLVDNEQRSWKWTYDGAGNLTSLTDGSQRTWLFQGYNSLGEVGTVLQPDGAVMVTQTYDSQGHALTKQLAGQGPTTYTYWPNGAIKSVTDPGGRAVNFAYDSAGHLTSSTDALGRAIVYTPDAAGNVTSVLDPAGNTSSTVYDGLGNVVAQTDGNHHTWTYFRDSSERLQKVQDPMGNNLNYLYDDQSRIQKIVDRNGATTTFSYDVDGRLIQESRPNNDNLVFTYDALGQMIAASDSSAHDDFTFDGVGNLASQTSCGPTATPTTPCAAGAAQPLVQLTYGYNASNQLTSIAGPDGTTSYSYDVRSRLDQITDPSHRNFGLAFDARDQLSGLTRPNGVNDTFTLDASGDLLSRNANLGQAAVSVSQYSPDAATGRIQQMTDTDGTHTYVYQADGQLLSATHPAPSGLAAENYTYDAAGNRTSWPGSPANTVSYDAADRLLSDGVNTYTYDLEGNLVAKAPRSNPSSVTTYDWNTDHQLQAIHYPDGTSSTYAYDALGRRVQAAGPGTTTRYVWDLNGNVHSEYDGSNQLIASYVQSLVQDKPLEVTEGGASYYYIADGAGNIRALTDQNGSVVDSYRYDSFGNQIATGSVHNPFTYSAREFDATSGLYYNRARYYDPARGRFISEDPLSRPSPYIYASNNPMSLHDPSGKAPDYVIIVTVDRTAAAPIIVAEQVELTYTVGVAAPLVIGEVSLGAEEVLLEAIIYGPLLFRLLALVVAFALLAKEACDFAHSADLPASTNTCPSNQLQPPPSSPCGIDLPDPGGDGTKPVVGPGK